jgi:hypothetical protein
VRTRKGRHISTDADAITDRCPYWCALSEHDVDRYGTVLHRRVVGRYLIELKDYILPDGARGYGEVLVDNSRAHHHPFITFADELQTSVALHQIQAILARDHTTAVVHDNPRNTYAPSGQSQVIQQRQAIPVTD